VAAHGQNDAIDPGCVKTPPLCYDSLVILRGKLMRRFVEQADRRQWALLPESRPAVIMMRRPHRACRPGSKRAGKRAKPLLQPASLEAGAGEGAGGH
jgi:hypothetical protein